ncbi:hypothetical protein FOXG_16439 [Fusarium oxysporum f. sp. lycopersici 4287]|uniref:Allergen Asp f 7 n=2 Tax=Fusarium oxysporum TaxID=5507 RepID=A0A0J9W900_FUSO4|nr:hypothetical protein FOXG_16439 [Fusarium oxysporum f. sp. lycopersici 4287]EWZ77973.1 hypothetical protein FOWG_17677 [Fusarium oxysporum f. sp. lycopersici MN25]KAJ9413881.1 hypothetical protein QL093DRAFT_2505244 [Fusarium oxysporum]KNB19318.1 hypothetical protein FOXG_16439 [Fusarium oxysporum f. sp. lycopersici 4287]
MKILTLVPAFLTTVAAVQPQGIIEIEWSSNCGYASKATNPSIPAANPTVIETPKIASAQAETPSPVPSNAPVVDSYPPIPSAGSTTENEQVPDPGVYSPYPSPSTPAYSQLEQKSELKTGAASPYGDVKSGNITFYDVGMGACGQNSSGQDETGSIVAISGDVYDASMIDGNTNNNPLCGRTITMKGSNGKTAQGTILDRCAGCRGGDIDVNHKIFIEIYGSLYPGRAEIEWWYS